MSPAPARGALVRHTGTVITVGAGQSTVDIAGDLFTLPHIGTPQTGETHQVLFAGRTGLILAPTTACPGSIYPAEAVNIDANPQFPKWPWTLVGPQPVLGPGDLDHAYAPWFEAVAPPPNPYQTLCGRLPPFDIGDYVWRADAALAAAWNVPVGYLCLRAAIRYTRDGAGPIFDTRLAVGRLTSSTSAVYDVYISHVLADPNQTVDAPTNWPHNWPPTSQSRFEPGGDYHTAAAAGQFIIATRMWPDWQDIDPPDQNPDFAPVTVRVRSMQLLCPPPGALSLNQEA